MKNFPFITKSLGLIVCLLAIVSITIPGPAFADALKKFAHQPLNDMANESSPYLRQHSRDLVQWNTWNKKTLAKAVKSGKPIYLSVGYSACHWCHVMQEESFNNEQVAKLLNEYFIPVLVDREQRPDLDETYMLATEAISGRGGWPNNVLLTPDLKPFYGGVYFPPKDLIKLLTLVASDWNTDKTAIQIEADRIAAILTGFFNRKNAAREITVELANKAIKKLLKSFDTFNGGIGTAPKHFNAPTLQYLISEIKRTESTETKQALIMTLTAIAKGGVHDHLAGGFHRYAIDNAWRIPHFEKMLYDQAQLAPLYAQAAILTRNPKFSKTAHKTYQYVLNDLTAQNGGFYSTRNADSEGEEGTYYVWTPEQLKKLLGEKDGKFLAQTLGTISDGDFAGKIILHRDIETSAPENVRVNKLFAKLLTHRRHRPAPFRDEKILASWNGLMISAFAKGAHYLSEEKYKTAATKAGDFIWNHMRDKDGALYRSYFEGKAQIVSTLPDYANMANAYLDLYDLTGDEKWLLRAKTFAEKMNTLFRDKKIGDFFFTSSKQGYARIKLRSDSALPSGNAMALNVFQRLAARSLDPKFQRQTEGLIAALSHDAIEDSKGGATAMAAAVEFLHGQRGSLQFAGKGQVKLQSSISPDTRNFIIKLSIAPKWHINSNKPFEKDFVPTALKLTTADGEKTVPFSIQYPKAVSRILGFQEKPLSLFENTIELKIKLTEPLTRALRARLSLQICNDNLCLLPEEAMLRINPPLLTPTKKAN